MKERVIKEEGVWPQGHGRPDFSAIVDGVREDINVVDTLKDNLTPNARERRGIEKLNKLKGVLEDSGVMRWIGKSKGMTDEEYIAMVDEFVVQLVDEWERRLESRER